MKVKDAIARADALRPNVISTDQKIAWLRELEGKFAETRMAPGPTKQMDTETTLLIPPPCDNVYELYLCAMIDYANQETNLYANDMAVFNAAYDEARAWWRRHNRPRPQGNWRVM